MSESKAMWLAASVLLLLLAHLVRAYRWSLLFPRTQAEPDRRGLLLSLGIGYAVNAIVPFRIGEIIRAAVATKLRRVRFPEVMATVVAERVADISVVTAFMLGSWLSASGEGFPIMALATTALIAALAGSAIALRHSASLRRLLWLVAGIFNPRIRVAVADFAWSTAEILVGGTILRWQFTATTFVMWSTYFAAYSCFAAAIGISLGTVMDPLLLQPLLSMLQSSAGTIIASSDIRLFVLAPVAIILVIQLLCSQLLRGRGSAPSLPYRGPKPHFAASTRFNHSSNYDGFLDALFSDARSVVSGFGMQAVGDCVVHRYLHGGSEALTALVETSDRMLIRKFGMGTAATKLKQQAEWLQRHAHGAVPVVPVLDARAGQGTFSYDMPLWDRTSEYHEAIHSHPLPDTSRTFLKILHSMDRLHGTCPQEIASASQVDDYLARKVADNAGQLTAFARQSLGGETYWINGVEYHLDEWAAFHDPVWLNKQLCDRRTAVIHGDLTVENVVVAPEHADGFYIIDPNPENIFDSPLIDWAKMMQSLHLGYEGLNKSSPITLADRSITLPIARSEAYASLHTMLEAEIVSRFAPDALREVYFHELVNYLRLTPYKVRQSAERGLAFFACTSLLLRKYREAFA